MRGGRRLAALRRSDVARLVRVRCQPSRRRTVAALATATTTTTTTASAAVHATNPEMRVRKRHVRRRVGVV